MGALVNRCIGNRKFGTDTYLACKSLRTKASMVGLAPITGETTRLQFLTLHHTLFGGILIGLPVMVNNFSALFRIASEV